MTDALEVTEVTSSELEGYAGFFDSSDDQITISEELEDMVIVHEASHAWFDGGLFQERWIGEGLADEYAARILAADNPGDARENPSPVAATDAAAFALNTWAPPNRVDEDSAAYERFGYDASWTVMRAIIDDVTEPKMRDVFKAAASRTLTYAGAGPAEDSGFVPDWRRFLDLVTDVGGSTKAEGLLETWVLTPKDTTELAIRATVRTRYFALVKAGGDWLPGIVIRKPMSNWRFGDASDGITDAAGGHRCTRRPDRGDRASSGSSRPERTGVRVRVRRRGRGPDRADDPDRRAGPRPRRPSERHGTSWPGSVRRSSRSGCTTRTPNAGYDAAVAAFAAGDEAGVLAGPEATIAASGRSRGDRPWPRDDGRRGRRDRRPGSCWCSLSSRSCDDDDVQPVLVAAPAAASAAPLGPVPPPADPVAGGPRPTDVPPPPTETRRLDDDPLPPGDAVTRVRRRGPVRYTRRHSGPRGRIRGWSGQAREERNRTDGPVALAAVARDPLG